MSQKAIAELQSETQKYTTEITLEAQKSQTTESLLKEYQMLQLQLADNQAQREIDLEMAHMADKTSRYDIETQAQLKREEIASNERVATITDAVMAKAALVKATGYGLKEARKTLESIMDWDVDQANQTTTHYYGYESDRSRLSGRIQSFFDEAAQSYTNFAEEMQNN